MTHNPPASIVAFANGGYLPISITSDGKISWNVKLSLALRQQADKWSWSNPWNPFLLGALYAFERANKLPVKPGSYGWKHLPSQVNSLIASGQYIHDPKAWTWVIVRRGYSQETATLFRLSMVAGQPVMENIFTTSANTGVFNGTPLGTWPIYLRYRVTSMRGSMLVSVPAAQAQADRDAHSNGSTWASLGVEIKNGVLVHRIHYNDSNILWVSYFHRGDALHYFQRKTYGWPQSAGCVEMPKDTASRMWHDVWYGTPVSVVDEKNVQIADLNQN